MRCQGDDRIHNQHLASRPKRAVACFKNPRRRVVVPVVKDVLHDNRVGARWQFFEEVAAFDAHSAGDASASECRGGASRNMRKIEQYTTHRLVAAQDGGQQQTVSARNVHQYVSTPLKSYASDVARAPVALIDVIAPSKTAATSGFLREVFEYRTY